MSPRVLIFGTGSIGAVYAYILSQSIPSSQIVTICRSNFEAASKNGFIINSTLFGNNLNVKPQVARTVEEAVKLSPQPFDYILVCSKAVQTTPSTAELIKPAVSEGTTIVLIQNGIGIEEPFVALFPNNCLLSTVVYLPSTQTEPGIISHKEVAELHVGTYPPSDLTTGDSESPASKLAAILTTSSGSLVKLYNDIQPERWNKLILNASWNPVCALSRTKDATFLASSPDALQFIRDVMLEVISIANACGYETITAAMADAQLERSHSRGLPGVEPSMMADALANRNMEVEAIVGNPVRLAKKHGVAVPLLQTIYLLVQALDGSFTRSRD